MLEMAREEVAAKEGEQHERERERRKRSGDGETSPLVPANPFGAGKYKMLGPEISKSISSL